MVETYMFIGAVTFAKYLILGNMVAMSARKMVGTKPSNKIVMHRKWSDIK
jgi:hypothetical protein